MKEEVLVVCRMMTGETNQISANHSTAAAHHGLFSGGFRWVLPFPFVFHVGPSSGFKACGGLVHCGCPVQMIGKLCCPLTVINVAPGEGPL